MAANLDIAVAPKRPAPEATPPRKSKLPLITVILAVVAALGGGGFVYMQRSSAQTKSDSRTSKKAAAAETDDEEEVPVKKDKDKASKSESSDESKPKSALAGLSLPKDGEVKRIVEIQPFILNLADREDNRFLRLTLNLGVGEGGDEKPDPVFIARVRNAVLAVLMTKTSAEVLSQEGKTALRKELLQAIRTVTEEPKVQVIYITELIVQR